MSPENLEDLLRECTVAFYGDGDILGSGFFVAPDKILTCAHVIKDYFESLNRLIIRHNGQDYLPSRLLGYFPEYYPDLALVEISVTGHECAWLDGSMEADDHLYTFGHTQVNVNGESGTYEAEGWVYQTPNTRLLKFKSGQVIPGFSGSPLMNLATGCVCGVVKWTRDTLSDLGGYAIPVEALAACFPDLVDENASYQLKNLLWRDLRDRHLASTPRRELPVSPGRSVVASKITQPEDLETVGAEYFVGHKARIKELLAFLQHGHSMVITGLPGMGKTALAARLAELLLTLGQQKGDVHPVLWLDAGENSIDVITEALADGLDHREAVVGKASGNKLIALLHLLSEQRVSLIVLDNAWLPEVIEKLEDAIPKGTPLLVTSRRRIACLDKLVEVDELPQKEALKILAYYAGDETLVRDPMAARLVKLFDNHPLATEIAGARLKCELLTPSDLIASLENAPHTVKLPELGKPGVEDLFNVYFDTLPQAPKRALLTFGAFSSPGLSLELLTTCLQSSKDQVMDWMQDLFRRNLVKKRLRQNFYELHDLVFSYCRGYQRLSQPEVMTSSPDQHLLSSTQLTPFILTYLNQHAQDYDLLLLDMPNLLGAAKDASPHSQVQIIAMLVAGGYPLPAFVSFFNACGHTLPLLERLDQSIEAARTLGDEVRPTLHYLLGKRGDAHFERGELEQAEACYKQALAIQINAERTIKLSSLTGKTLAFQGRQAEAGVYFRQAYRIARLEKEPSSCSFLLGQQVHSAGENNQFMRARRLAVYHVAINQRWVAANPGQQSRKSLFYSLINLGSAELAMAGQSSQALNTALAYHLRAKQVADDLGSEIYQAHACAALGEDYHALEQRQQAQVALHQAVHLFRSSGQTRDENKYVRYLEANGYPPVEG